jgi:hypothetical protein
MCFSRIKNIKSLTSKNSGTLIVIKLAIFVVEYLGEYKSIFETAFAHESVDPEYCLPINSLASVPLNSVESPFKG